jgi:hypothetical protein
MKIRPYLISDCCEVSIIKETDICSRCKEHCEPQTEEECYKLSGKIKEKDKLLKIIIEHYNIAIDGCNLTNVKLAEKLAIENLNFDNKKHTVTSERISYILRELKKDKKIEIKEYFAHPRGKIIKLIDKVCRNEATKIFVEKHKKSA